MDFENEQKNKRHNKRTKGAKVKDAKEAKFQAEKKEGKKSFKGETREQAKLRNPKAFAISGGVDKARMKENAMLNNLHRKEHLPIANRSDVELPPPIIVAVQGPPGVGKSTLVRCLVKHYTKHNVNDLKGPCTFVAAKKRRITLIEVPNNMTAMIDAAKIADLVLLVIDAHFGYEMETFEFLNLMQTHGFPKVIGVLTHLDLFQKRQQQKKAKNILKRRFWKEIYEGAKLFHMEGMKYGKYMKRDIVNLGRFLSTQKFKPLIWRNTHPYVLVDRVEDVTNPELIRQNNLCDRKVAMFGYIHGTQLKKNAKVLYIYYFLLV